MRVKFQLNHSSNFPGCVGQTGEVVICEKEIADEMVSRCGGTIIGMITGEEKETKKDGKSSSQPNRSSRN